MREISHKVWLCIAFILTLSACHAPIEVTDKSVEKSFRENFKPSTNMARVYVFAPVSRNIFTGGDLARPGRIEVDIPVGKPLIVGEVTDKKFVGFDANPGIISLHYLPYDGNLKGKNADFHLNSNQTIALRPVISGSGAMFGLVGMAIASMTTAGDGDFRQLDLAYLPQLMEGKNLTQISPEAKKIFSQAAQ